MTQQYIDMLRDPFDKSNPYKIKKHPPGLRLSWRGLPQSQKLGFRGWTPVEKGDGIYEKLPEYINEPPLKHVRNVDSQVIRGQNILCWMPAGMMLSRKMESAKRANLAKARAKAEASKQLQDGMSAFGPGLRRLDKKPDPTDLEVICKAYGISEEDLNHPAADPRNYSFGYKEDGSPKTVFIPSQKEDASDAPVSGVEDTEVKRGRGRPKGSKNKPKGDME